MKYIITLITSLLLNLAYANSSVHFTPNEEKAIVFTMKNMMLNEISHGNYSLFFLINPDDAYFTDAPTLYSLYEDNSFRASEIIQSHLFKVIGGRVESITSDRRNGAKVALISLKTSNHQNPYRQPLKVKMYEAFNEKAMQLKKGDYISIFGIVFSERSSGFNSFIFFATDPPDFMHDHAKYRLSEVKTLLDNEKDRLTEYDLRDLYVAVKIRLIAKKNNDFKDLSDDEIEEIISKFEVDLDDYAYFQDMIIKSAAIP